MRSTKVALVMPVYNEVDGISAFLQEIDDEFEALQLIIVDDASTDSTSRVVSQFMPRNMTIRLVKNEQNRGHGPSTLRALQEGLDSGAGVVLALDGDGQVSAADLRRMLTDFHSTNCDLLIGVRMGRNESAFRMLTSWATRVITGVRSRKRVPDANTPFRVYRSNALKRLLETVPSDSMVPNLWVTVISQRLAMDVRFMSVNARDRLGSSTLGSTCGRASRILPTRRFIRFCFLATVEWIGAWRHVRSLISMSRNSQSDVDSSHYVGSVGGGVGTQAAKGSRL